MPDELAEQIPMVHAACEALGVPILTSERYEADDVIGTLTMKAAAAGFDVAIVTGDKDFFQLVRDGIRVFNPRDEGIWYDADGVKEKFGVAPEQVVDVLALMGDTIDNIKGVPGIGDKGARELISKYGSPREPDRPRRRDSAEALSRAAARQRRVGAPEPSSSRAFGPMCRSTSIPTPFATAAPRANAASRSSTSWLSVRWSPSTRRPRPRPPRPTASCRAPRTFRRWPRGSTPAGRFALRVLSAGGSAMTASIVGLAFSTAPRDADYVPDRTSRTRAGRAAFRSTPRSTRCDRCSRIRAIAKVGHDLKFDAILLARHGVDLQRARHRHDDRELSARCHPVPAQARGSRARAHQLQGAHAKRMSAAAARRRCRSRTCRSRRRSITPASARTSPVQLAPLFRDSAEERAARRGVSHARAAADSGAGGGRARRRSDRHRRSRGAVAAGRAGAGPAYGATSSRLAGGEFNINSPKQLVGNPVRQAAAADPEADRHVTRAVDRRRRARGARARARAAAADSRVARR